MNHHKKQHTTRILVLTFTLILAFSAIVFAGLSTSPFTLKPVAGLGSCPLGTIHQQLER